MKLMKICHYHLKILEPIALLCSMGTCVPHDPSSGPYDLVQAPPKTVHQTRADA